VFYKFNMAQKRKVGDECRGFSNAWTELYFFIDVSGKPVCLICRESLAVMKQFNLKRHFDTRHKQDYSRFAGEARENQLKFLKNRLEQQQNSFQKLRVENDAVLSAS
jgi:hypothetical protein